MTRKIIHCDCDCFFAAIEMRDNPQLRDIPLAVGGRSDRRGVIATCNYPARAFGVRSAMSTARALQLCPSLTVVSGNMDKYRQASQQIMEIFREYSDLIEPLSLDEAFIDVTDCSKRHGSATLIAKEIRKKVREAVGITLSAGVAPNKFLAKVASDWNKPDGQFVITPDQVDAFVETLPVNKISGVGEKLTLRLHEAGVETCGDLRSWTLPELIDRFGKMGQRLYEHARGIDDRPVRVSRVRKSVSVEHTYPRDLAGLADCIEQLPVLLSELKQRYERLRGNPGVSGVFVKVKFCDFVQTTAEQVADAPSSELFKQLMAEAYSRGGRAVRLLGVGYRLKTDSQKSPEQLSLLND